jgi:hypothetical protein
VERKWWWRKKSWICSFKNRSILKRKVGSSHRQPGSKTFCEPADSPSSCNGWSQYWATGSRSARY